MSSSIFAFKRLLSLLVLLMISISSAYAINVPAGVGSNGDTHPNLLLWLKADTGVIESGGKVLEWQDQSGKGFHVSQPDPNKQPTYQANILNGQPVIRFDGIDDYLSVDIPDFENGFMLFIVSTVNANAEDGAGLFSSASAANPNTFQVDVVEKHTTDCSTKYRFQYHDNVDNVKSVCGNSYANTPTITVANYNKDKTKVAMYANGLQKNQNMESMFSNLFAEYVIGTDRRKEGFLNGDIAEIILYSNSQLFDRRHLIATYLSDKYSISLDEQEWYGVYSIQTAGNQTSENAAGLTITNNTFLQESKDEFSVMYDTLSNSWKTSYIGDNIHAHWGQSWYFYKIDDNENGGTIDLTFDFSDAGITESPTTLPYDYQLVHRFGIFNAYQSMDITATAIVDDKVIFAGVDVNLLNDRFYTLATVNHVPIAGFGTALNLDGEDDYVDLSPHIANIEGLNQGTISGWFKTDRGSTEAIFSISESSTNKNHIVLATGQTTSAYIDESITFIVYRDSTGPLNIKVRHGEDFYADNRWHHFAVVTGNGDNRVYIDGINQPVTFQLGNNTTNEFTHISNSDRMRIGNLNRKGNLDEMYFQGQIDELRIWNYPLSEAEIQTNMYRKLNGNEFGLLAYYPFEGSANDMSPNTNDGTLANMDNTAWIAWQTFITEQGITINGTLLGFDANGDSLTYEIVDQASKGILAIIDPNSGEFIYTPNGGQTGIDTFTYRVCDIFDVCSEPATVTLEITEILNQQPSFTTNGNPPAVSEDAGQQFVLAWVTEFNQGLGEIGQTVADYLMTNLSNPELFEIEPDVDNAGNLIYTPAANLWGTATFDVAVQDNGGTAGGGLDTSEFQTFTITINPVADTPSVTNSYSQPMLQSTDGLVISRHSADGSEMTHFKVTNFQNGILYKNDGITQINENTFISVAEGNVGLKFTSNSTNQGSFDVQASISADDSGLGGDPVTATIYVNIDNKPPILDEIGNQNIIIGNSLTFTATAHDPNLPPNNFFFKLIDAPEGAVIAPTTGIFTWTPANTGRFTFTVEIEETDGTDGINFKDSEQITITVNDTTPVLASIDDMEVSLTETIRFTATATDPEDHALMYSLNGAPAGAEINPTTGEFVWMPTVTGHFKVTVIVTDVKGFSDNQVVNLTVTTAPILAPIGDKETQANRQLMFTADATHPGGNVLTFSLENVPTGATIDPQTGVFKWTPTQPGAYDVTVVVTETEGGSDSETITITIKATPTSLDLALDSRWIFKNAPLRISGWLNRYPDTGTGLENLPIQLTITAPNNTVTTVEIPTNEQGEYVLEISPNLRFDKLNDLLPKGGIPNFDQKGVYYLQTMFAGNDALNAAQSPLKSLKVRALAGYALLIQGRDAQGSGQAAYQKSLNRVYRQMKRRGFTDDNIEYFNFNDNQIGGGILVDGISNKPNIMAALQRLQIRMNMEPAPLYIVMVDHGGVDGSFHLDNSDGEKIMPAELDNWLNNLENNLNPEALAEPRVAILGSCYSGSFIPTISQPGRVVITSATAQEESYKGPKEPDEVRSGEFFMEALFAQLGRGKSFKTSFELATASTEILTRADNSTEFNAHYQDNAVQHPLLDDNGDTEGSNVLMVGQEGEWARNLYLGLGPQFNPLSPDNPADILEVTPAVHLGPNETSAELLARVNNPIRVAGSVVVVDIRSPSVTLSSNGTEQTGQLEINNLQRMYLYSKTGNRFAATFEQFKEAGQYEIFYFVQDTLTSDVSPLKSSTVYKDKAGNLPPYAFELQTPAHESETATTLILAWENSFDPEGEPITYTFLLATNANFNNVVYRQAALTYATTALDQQTMLNDAFNEDKSGLRDGTQYFWKVEAIDGFGARTTSAVFSFTTNNKNAPPSVASIHVSSAVNFISLDNAIIDFWQLDEFGNPILDEFGNPLLLEQPPVIHQEHNFYNMLLPPGRRRVTLKQPGMESQAFDLDNANGQAKLLLKDANTQEQIIELDSDEGFKNLNFSMKSVNQMIANHGQLQFSVNQIRLDEDNGLFRQAQQPEERSLTLSKREISFLVNRIGGHDGEVSVSYLTLDGSANVEKDYQPATGILTWADKEALSKRISFTILNDSQAEGEEYLTLLLNNPTGGAELGQHQQLHLIIVDDDEGLRLEDEPEKESSLSSDKTQGIQFAAPTYTAVEGDGAITTITIMRPRDPHDEMSVQYLTTGKSTATEGLDYLGGFGSITWLNGDNQPKTLNITLQDDHEREGPETIHFLLFNSHGNVGPQAETVLTILDNDNPGPLSPTTTEPIKLAPAKVQFLTPSYFVTEADTVINLPVMRVGNHTGPVSVHYAPTAYTTAFLDADYTGGSGTLVWPDGDTQPQSIQLTLLDDEEIENIELIEISLFKPNGALELGTIKRAVLIITDNDEVSQITVESSPNNEVQPNDEIQPTENSLDLVISPTNHPETGQLDLPSLGTGVVLRKPSLPDLGFGVVIAENSSRTTLCQQDNCEINSIFRGGVSLNGWDYHNSIQINPKQRVWIDAEIEINAGHIGQIAELLMGVLYSPNLAQTLPWWLVRDEQWGIINWDGELDNLHAAFQNITLTSTQTFNIYEGVIGEGHLQGFFGYRLKNGTIVYNGEQAIEIVVQP